MSKSKEELVIENYNLRKENEELKERVKDLQDILIEKNER